MSVMLANGMCPRCHTSMRLTATACAHCGRRGNAVVEVDDAPWNESWLIAVIVILVTGLIAAAWLY